MKRVASFLILVGALALVTACEQGSGSSTTAADSGVSADTSGGGPAADPLGAVAAHNAARGRSPASPPLADMVSSPTLAATAQAWADQCRFEHNSNRGQVGENIFWGSATYTADQVVTSWEGEVADYDYATNTCAAGKVCGHYTQVVWRDSVNVGCAVKDCTTVVNASAGQIWVCNYDPAGNFTGQKPY